MPKKCGIGVIGPGRIAEKFAKTLHLGLVSNAVLRAAASNTSLERAKSFAAAWNIPKAYGSYQELLADPSVDLVYVATTNNTHYQCCLQAIRAGKAVLCEKPMVMTKAEAMSLHQTAKEQGVFLMEAMWSRFTPAVIQAKQWINQGKIGRLHAISADLCVSRSPKEYQRLFDPALGGGALFDLGVYCFEMLQYFAAGKKLLDTKSFCQPAQTGVDLSTFLLASYEGGLIGEMKCSIGFCGRNEAYLYGDNGYIRLAPFFSFGHRAELFAGPIPPAAQWRVPDPTEAFLHESPSGFEGEIQHAAQCVLEGRIESDVMPMSDTIECAGIFDKILSGLEKQEVL